MTALRLLWLVVLTVAVCAPSPAAAQADPNKVLRVAFPVAETGFDPQVTNDLYSAFVERAIFDPPYTYDYLARPFKLVPNTAVALPEISADGRGWTLRIKPGIYFNDDPAFKGMKRELTAADYVFSWKRVLDPKVRSQNLQTFDDLFEGSDAAIARAKETGKFDYDAPMEGLLALDRYTIRIRLKRPSYVLRHRSQGAAQAGPALSRLRRNMPGSLNCLGSASERVVASMPQLRGGNGVRAGRHLAGKASRA